MHFLLLCRHFKIVMRTHYLLTLLGLSTLLATSCQKEEDTTIPPEPVKQYNMPLQLGNKWIYNVSKVDTFGDVGTDHVLFMDTMEVLYKVTRDMFPNNHDPALDILNKYDWYMVKGSRKSFGAVCNAGDNLVLSIQNLEAAYSIDTLIQDTDLDEELFSQKGNSFFNVYRKGYGKPVNINGYPSKRNMTYSVINADGKIIDVFVYFYSKGVGITRFGATYTAPSGYEQYTLKNFIPK